MDLILLVLMICLVGFVVYLLTTYIPMPPVWAKAVQVISLAVMLLYLLTRFVRIPDVLPR